MEVKRSPEMKDIGPGECTLNCKTQPQNIFDTGNFGFKIILYIIYHKLFILDQKFNAYKILSKGLSKPQSDVFIHSLKMSEYLLTMISSVGIKQGTEKVPAIYKATQKTSRGND